MIEIQYKGETVTVENEQTPYEAVVDIGEENLFVCEANHHGKRYAFNIEDIYEQFKQNNNLLNFQVVPHVPFSVDDIRELRARHKGIDEFVGQYFESCKIPLEKISQQTILQIQLLSVRAGLVPRDKDFIEEIKSRYSAEELEMLNASNLTIQDVARGEAFARFKNYYAQISKEEKIAIHLFPGVAQILKMTGLSALDDILKLKPESCLGGTAGACNSIAQSIRYMKQLGQVEVMADVEEQVFEHVADPAALLRTALRINPSEKISMLLNFQFSSVITSENVHHMQVRNADEAWEILKNIDPRGGAEVWRDLFQKLHDNQHRIAIVDYALSPDVIRRYLQEKIGIPKEILDRVIIETCNKRPTNMNKLITEVQNRSGNEKLPDEQVWLVSDRMDYVNSARIARMSTFVVTGAAHDASFMKPLTAAITEQQIKVLTPERQYDMPEYDSNGGTPTTLLSSRGNLSLSNSMSLSGSIDLKKIKNPSEMKVNLAHSGELATAKVEKTTKEHLTGAAQKLTQLNTAGFFGNRGVYEYNDLQYQLKVLIGNRETKVQPYESLLSNIEASELSSQQKMNLYSQLFKHLSAAANDKFASVLERIGSHINDVMRSPKQLK